MQVLFGKDLARGWRRSELGSFCAGALVAWDPERTVKPSRTEAARLVKAHLLTFDTVLL